MHVLCEGGLHGVPCCMQQPCLLRVPVHTAAYSEVWTAGSRLVSHQVKSAWSHNLTRACLLRCSGPQPASALLLPGFQAQMGACAGSAMHSLQGCCVLQDPAEVQAPGVFSTQDFGFEDKPAP